MTERELAEIIWRKSRIALPIVNHLDANAAAAPRMLEFRAVAANAARDAVGKVAAENPDCCFVVLYGRGQLTDKFFREFSPFSVDYVDLDSERVDRIYAEVGYPIFATDANPSR
ncbi:hypothetical protein D3C87_1773000 [compost metagenome]